MDGGLDARFVCDRSFEAQSRDLMAHATYPVPVQVIAAGKIRRYHGISWWKQLMDVPTMLLNIRDLFFIAMGGLQSLWLLWRWRPDVVFLKGGFVCVPVGFAAKVLGVPIVMHDSDTHPGLANRIVSRWARSIATGSPLKYYTYPADKTVYVGVPISAEFTPFTAAEKEQVRRSLGFPEPTRPLIVATGGGLGAQRINDAVIASASDLIDNYGAAILHVSGQSNYDKVKQRAPVSPHYQLVPFVGQGMAEVLAAADIVITRAGATTMLELAAVQACAVIIPHPNLTGGHQMKNAAMYAETGAAEVIPEARLLDSLEELQLVVGRLLADEGQRRRMGQALGKFARPHAARDVASLIVKAGQHV